MEEEEEEIINFIRYISRASEAEMRQALLQLKESKNLIHAIKIISSTVP